MTGVFSEKDAHDILLDEQVSAESLVEYTDALAVNGISVEKIF